MSVLLLCVTAREKITYELNLRPGERVILIRPDGNTPAEYIGKTVWGDEAFLTDVTEYINWEKDVEHGDLVIVHAPKEES